MFEVTRTEDKIEITIILCALIFIFYITLIIDLFLLHIPNYFFSTAIKHCAWIADQMLILGFCDVAVGRSHFSMQLIIKARKGTISWQHRFCLYRISADRF